MMKLSSSKAMDRFLLSKGYLFIGNATTSGGRSYSVWVNPDTDSIMENARTSCAIEGHTLSDSEFEKVKNLSNRLEALDCAHTF
ncbi:hypothetical protein vBPMCPL1_0102 [Proteus phage vB_PMC-PL1]